MTDYQKIIPIANKILKKHELCDNCLGRLFSKKLRLSSNKLLGKKLKNKKNYKKKCYVCKDLFENLNYFLKLMITSSSEYSFSTFSVGALIKPSIMDRDDYIRSKYKLKGIDSVKTDVTKELGKLFSRKTKKKIDFLDPHLTFTVNIKDEICDVRSKSLTLSGRYVKRRRDVLQKQKPCSNCSGKGCRNCNFHGISEFDSIEGIISKCIFETLGGTTAKFTWIGGEDTSSMVLGSGRPFFMKLQNPHNRNLNSINVKSEYVEITNLRIVPESPKTPLRFISHVKIKIFSKTKLDSKILRKLKDLLTYPTIVYEKSGKRSEKKIFSLKYSKKSDYDLLLYASMEGGLPIKRFVTSDNVSPGISNLLENSCICKQFDFLDIELK